MLNKLYRFVCIWLVICFFGLSTPAMASNVEDTLSLGILSNRTYELRPLDPLERDMISIYGMVYESLVTVDDNGMPQPLLAENWTETGGGKTWTFTLREGITFSDGEPLTAYDVVASCQYLLDKANSSDPSVRGFYQNIRYLISSIKATGDRTVEVKARRSYYGLLYTMTFPVVPASQVDIPNPLGTGPYRFSLFEPCLELLLVVNENWWQTLPMVKSIFVRCFLNNKALINAYETNAVDTAFTRSVSAAQYKSGINALSIPYSTRQLEVLLINHRAFPLESLNVRQAIRYALNIPLISQTAYMNMTIPAQTPYAPDTWLFYDQEGMFGYNPEKAAQLLAEDGWTDSNNDNILDTVVGGEPKNLRLRLYVYEDPENNVRFETADMIVDMLAAVKIKAVPTTMTYEKLKSQLEAGSFDLALCAFQMDVVPDVGFFLIKGNEQNYGRYVSSEMTSLLETLRTQETAADFAYTSQAIQQRFALDLPFICLFYRSGAILTRKMYTTVRSIREFELLRGIEAFGR